MSLQYEPASEPLHIFSMKLFHPGVELRVHLKPICHGYHLFEVACVWGSKKITSICPWVAFAAAQIEDLGSPCGADADKAEEAHGIERMGYTGVPRLQEKARR